MLSGTITFAAGSAVADIFAVPSALAATPVLFTLQPGLGYVVGAGASVNVNMNMVVPSSTIDFATIRTDVNYTIEIRAVTTQPGGFGVLIQPLIGTVTVKIGDKTDDIRDKIDTLLENAGYTTKPRAGSKLKVYTSNNLQGLQFTFKDAKDATGQVPPDGLKPPTLIENLGLPIELFFP